ncbi:nickel-dependent hydrogenase large subunit [Candidatus Aerophobetes bacterium]|nr:nickel-dependent hydrogenase large subunit [Candidatus Aerophobetes bacterium]
MEKIIIDPITRIEGHLKVEVTVDKGEVKDARLAGTLFRGWEIILKGRDARDASQITQRVCGVCPAVHANASVFALDDAFGVKESIPDNARIIRNLILGANFLQSHILHFYHLSSLDFFDVAEIFDYEGKEPDLISLKKFLGRGKLSPFTPRYEGDYRLDKKTNQEFAAHYIKALEIRRKCHEMLAIFGGKMPHSVGIVAGGVTEKPCPDKIASFLWRLNEIRDFINNFYLPDTLTLVRFYEDNLYTGSSNSSFLSYGAFNLDSGEFDPTKRNRLFAQGVVSQNCTYETLDVEAISEYIRYSWYSQNNSNLHPARGITEPDEKKEKAYSWLKAPRYRGEPCEVGPAARMIVSYFGGKKSIKEALEKTLSQIGGKPVLLSSTLGRHIARALDAKLVADNMAEWILQLKIDEPVYTPCSPPEKGEGMGLTDGPRGALGHWIRIKDKLIDNYQMVVPTTWNASPRDDKDEPGPVERALLGLKVKDTANPFEVVRCVRSFDPCLACAVHLITPRGKKLNSFRVS